MAHTVLIIGGGPAGLTAAWRLATQGYAVTLIERSERLGGRLLCSGADATQCDAIPPVFMGHQTATLALLKELGTTDPAVPSRGLRLEFLLPGGRHACLMQPWLPAPFHTMLGLMLFGGLPVADRWRLLDIIERSWEGDPALPQNLDQRTAEEWLAERNQSERARADVWTPLARFLIGDGLATVSAAALVSVFTRCFLTARRHARLAVPTDTLHDLLLAPLAARLTQAGATIRLNTAAVLLQIENDRVTGVRLRDGATLTADHYIMALPHTQLTAILPERVLTHYSYFQQLTQLSDSPALTVHLRIDTALQAPRIVLFARRTFHWLVSRPGPRRSGTLISVVATGKPELFERTDQDLIALALDKLAYAYPGSEAIKLLDSRVVREPRAFLTMSPGARVHRPLPQSPFQNLLIGGDWTDTGLPATLESAIVSGTRCADMILAKKE
ncbi:MAG: hydroxysqualene dehydroxylase HpnE [Nitrospirota bacterium]